MNIEYKAIQDLSEVYEYMQGLSFPYRYETDFQQWEKSFAHDEDGEGRPLFRELTTIGAYISGKFAGFVQYGETAIGFDNNGEITGDVSYPVIRNLYFAKGQEEIGGGLLDRALTALSGDRIYAFFHYFGMSCYARHGKLFGEFGHIHDLLLKKGFVTEHENVFYSSRLNAPGYRQYA